MFEAVKVISLVKNTSSYNDKQYLLKKNENTVGLKEILRFIYDPYYRTGISTAKLNKALAGTVLPYEMGKTPFVSYQDIIAYLKKHNTGSDRDLEMAARFINCSVAVSTTTGFTEALFDVLSVTQADSNLSPYRVGESSFSMVHARYQNHRHACMAA